MKRLFLCTICTLSLLVFLGQSLTAQQAATTPSSNDNVIIIQKTQNEDGTWTVKKKSIQKGESADAYFKEMDLENATEQVSEITINTNGSNGSEDAETVMMIRKGSNRTEIKWNGEGNDMEFNGLHDLSKLALIGDVEATETKPLLGIYPETKDDGTVLVTDIVPGSGAAEAGLKSGDVITAIEGAKLSAHGDLGKALATHQPGDAVKVTYLRDGQSLTTSVVLTAKKEQRHHYNYNYNYNSNYDYNYTDEHNPCDVFIGVVNGSWGNGEKGVGVTGIIAGWPAEEAGLKVGDRILSMDGVEVNTHNELLAARNKHKAGERFTLGILRDGNEIKVKAHFKSCETEEAVLEQPVIEQPTAPKFDNNLQLEELTAYPNPTYGDLNVQFKGEAVPTTVTVTDISGKQVFNESLPNFDGFYSRQLDVTNGTPGTLLITIRQNGKVVTTPVVLLTRA